MDEKNRIENRIGVLDGIRAIAIGMVVWFHFWQQTWLTPYLRIPTEYTKYIGLTEINLAGWVRYGFVFVDMMILLAHSAIFILMQDLLFWERTGRIRRHFTERGQQEYCLLTILCWRSICFSIFYRDINIGMWEHCARIL